MKRAIRRLWSAIDLIMAGLLVAMIALVFANVVLRYGFSSGIRQTVELARLWFIWIVMLGAVTVLHRGEHLGMPELVENHFPSALPWVNRFNWLVILGSSVMLTWGSIRVTQSNWANISQLTGLAQGWFYLPGVISGAMMAAIALVRIVHPETGKHDRAHGDIA